MKKSRCLSELLCILSHYSYLLSNYHCNGLCALVKFIYFEQNTYKITYEEYKILQNFIKNNRPFNLRTFISYFKDSVYTRFYWKPGDRKSREKWINKHIRKQFKHENTR